MEQIWGDDVTASCQERRSIVQVKGKDLSFFRLERIRFAVHLEVTTFSEMNS